MSLLNDNIFEESDVTIDKIFIERYLFYHYPKIKKVIFNGYYGIPNTNEDSYICMLKQNGRFVQYDQINIILIPKRYFNPNQFSKDFKFIRSNCCRIFIFGDEDKHTKHITLKTIRSWGELTSQTQ